ncbi:DUF192 domain-containing protein [Mesorhizobium sp. B2-3-4]|uniref:DUF192 domain-containing protein n=1 Tax=Mesorhizobium sp. B2-3-4 TaxID=2589959 RepID=UPI001127AA94|nr:DUF192 domain-containing protein [Mesorhizobium sp. B2-3-4]TPM41725.1 DUF192 domain-containing protein [Mesorhizobium sp. B2-3-4]
MTHRNGLTAGVMCAVAAVIIAAAAFFYFQVPTAADSRAMILPVDPAPLIVATKGGDRSFSIEVADTDAEREAGLMYRQDMASDHGMLFVFPIQQQVGFWMKNTPMPLDMVFIGQDGKIRAIKHGEPQSEAVVSPGVPVRFVLELKAGTAAANGIEYGNLLHHPAIGTVGGPGVPPTDNGDAPNGG